MFESNSSGKIKYLKLAGKLFNYFSIEKNKELELFDRCSKLVEDNILAVRMELVLYMEIAKLYFPSEAELVLNKLFAEK